MNKQNKGITLIALVITIVVLVILVGVSVAVAINTGLIANSKKAVADYDVAQKDEEAEIQKVADIMNSMDPDSLATKVKVGDYVKYTPEKGEFYESKVGAYNGDVTTINEKGEPTGSGTQGNGHSVQKYTVPDDTSGILWRVLSIENGKVNLVSEKEIGKNGVWTGEDSDKLYLSGLTGYAYGEEEINEVCKIYGTGKGAEGARSITVGDVNKITGYDVTKDSDYKETYGTVNGWADGYRWKNTDYEYSYNKTGLNLNTADTSKIPYSLIFEGKVDDLAYYWLASGCIEASYGTAFFNMRCITEDYVFTTTVFSGYSDRDPYGNSSSYPIRPVVTLKSTVKAGTPTTVNGVTTWEIDVPEED